MRIACLTQCYPPSISGASIVARQLAEGMAQRGHQVMVVAPSGDGRPRVVQTDKLMVMGLRSYHNPLRVRHRFMLSAGHDIFDALEEFRPDIIHSHDFFQVGMAGIRYARRAGIPICTTLHQLPWYLADQLSGHATLKNAAEETLWAYARWLLRQHSNVVAPTQTVADVVTNRTRLPVQVISNGVDLETFRPPLSSTEKSYARTRLNLTPDVPLLLHVGQLIRAKRVDRVIEAAARLMQFIDAYLLIVGDGPQKMQLLQQCMALGIADRTHFAGYITAEMGLPEIYRAADVFVTASEIETQGIVLLEAAASGLPLVAVDATCVGEIVQDGVNGRLTGSGRLVQMSEAIQQILRDEGKSRSMSAASRRLAKEHSLHETFRKYERMYDMLQSREPRANLATTGRHERLYNWFSAIVRR